MSSFIWLSKSDRLVQLHEYMNMNSWAFTKIYFGFWIIKHTTLRLSYMSYNKKYAESKVFISNFPTWKSGKRASGIFNIFIIFAIFSTLLMRVKWGSFRNAYTNFIKEFFKKSEGKHVMWNCTWSIMNNMSFLKVDLKPLFIQNEY